MRLTITAFLSLFICTTSFAAYQQEQNPFTGLPDYVGVSTSRDIAIVCASGQTLTTTGGGTWACATGGSGSGITGLTADSGGTTTGTSVTLAGGGTVSTSRSGDTITITGSGGVSDGNKGDITVSGGGATWTINAGIIDESQLDASVNASLNLADSALQAEVDGSTTNEIQNIFQTISTTSGTAPVADSATDTLTLTAGSGITITGDASTDTVTFTATGGSTSPAGSEGEVQLNQLGAFGTYSNFKYDVTEPIYWGSPTLFVPSVVSTPHGAIGVDADWLNLATGSSDVGATDISYILLKSVPSTGGAGQISINVADAYGTNQNGGSIYLDVGASTGSGVTGDILLSDGNSGSPTITAETSTGIAEFGWISAPTGRDGKIKIYSEQGVTDYYTMFQPGTQTQNITYTLPNDDGNSNDVLSTDGSGTLSWVAQSAASGPTIGKVIGIKNLDYAN